MSREIVKVSETIIDEVESYSKFSLEKQIKPFIDGSAHLNQDLAHFLIEANGRNAQLKEMVYGIFTGEVATDAVSHLSDAVRAIKLTSKNLTPGSKMVSSLLAAATNAFFNEAQAEIEKASKPDLAAEVVQVLSVIFTKHNKLLLEFIGQLEAPAESIEIVEAESLSAEVAAEVAAEVSTEVPAEVSTDLVSAASESEVTQADIVSSEKPDDFKARVFSKIPRSAFLKRNILEVILRSKVPLSATVIASLLDTSNRDKASLTSIRTSLSFLVERFRETDTKLTVEHIPTQIGPRRVEVKHYIFLNAPTATQDISPQPVDDPIDAVFRKNAIAARPIFEALLEANRPMTIRELVPFLSSTHAKKSLPAQINLVRSALASIQSALRDNPDFALLPKGDKPVPGKLTLPHTFQIIRKDRAGAQSPATSVLTKDVTALVQAVPSGSEVHEDTETEGKGLIEEDLIIVEKRPNILNFTSTQVEQHPHLCVQLENQIIQINNLIETIGDGITNIYQKVQFRSLWRDAVIQIHNAIANSTRVEQNRVGIEVTGFVKVWAVALKKMTATCPQIFADDRQDFDKLFDTHQSGIFVEIGLLQLFKRAFGESVRFGTDEEDVKKADLRFVYKSPAFDAMVEVAVQIKSFRNPGANAPHLSVSPYDTTQNSWDFNDLSRHINPDGDRIVVMLQVAYNPMKNSSREGINICNGMLTGVEHMAANLRSAAVAAIEFALEQS